MKKGFKVYITCLSGGVPKGILIFFLTIFQVIIKLLSSFKFLFLCFKVFYDWSNTSDEIMPAREAGVGPYKNSALNNDLSMFIMIMTW